MTRLTRFAASLLLVVASTVASAAALTDYLESALLGHIFKGSAYTGPATTYVALHTAACSDSSVGTEVTGTGYARVAVTSNGTEWTGPTTGNGTISNANPITFGAPGANWNTATHWSIWDAPTGGNMLVCASLTTSKTINNGDAAPSFAAGALTVQIDN